jgi:hypothetical protein
MLLPWVARLLPLLAVHYSPLTKQPGSTLVLRWVLVNLRSTYLRLTRAYTHHSIVIIDLSAFHQHLVIRRLHYTHQSVSSTHLSVDLTHRRVSLTPWAVASSCNLLPWTVHPSHHFSTFIIAMTSCLVFCCVSACCFYFYVFSCFFLLYFVVFIFLLFCLGFFGFNLHLVLGYIFVVETSACGDSTLFSLIPNSNLISVFPLLTSFGWLMLFLDKSANGFGPRGVLTPVIRVCKSHEIYDSSYMSFAFQTAICGSLERTGLFIWPISYFVLVTYTIYLCVWVYCRGAHPFLVF